MYPVKDPKRARSFYEETLGLTVGSTSSKEGIWTEYDLAGGGLFGAVRQRRHKTQHRFWRKHRV
jgi:catechol 2,3-dioxygenase-like lactoylglutathione lyase family enzyme